MQMVDAQIGYVGSNFGRPRQRDGMFYLFILLKKENSFRFCDYFGKIICKFLFLFERAYEGMTAYDKKTAGASQRQLPRRGSYPHCVTTDKFHPATVPLQSYGVKGASAAPNHTR